MVHLAKICLKKKMTAGPSRTPSDHDFLPVFVRSAQICSTNHWAHSAFRVRGKILQHVSNMPCTWPGLIQLLAVISGSQSTAGSQS